MGNANGKPSSMPRHYPYSSQEELDEKPQRVVVLGGMSDDQLYSFCDNSIRTSKYEWYSFPGKFLMEQFNPYTKLANCYFLVISGMQVITVISNTNGLPTTLIPLSFVLVIAAVFGIIEDVARHTADRHANASLTQVYAPAGEKGGAGEGVWETVPWASVRVGQYVRVRSREVVPADVLVLMVAEPNPAQPKGNCYVETKSLDGETNLKVRTVAPALLGLNPGNLGMLQGRVVMEHPNNLID
eukprot:CAMPEP_0173237428 /NCGR_PEP_ID=MMETSP1142-20121109/12047_1 /TAXON_ID=483371 /ORGANISM="non described non described, Strain CCMP2298" /LENGTH=241 /DNA_ID=CAMNT_0014168121 /DNA_START=32 /DNA_END=754 /DNA_ORIENTATION=+